MGTELKDSLDVYAPSSKEMDIRDYQAVLKVLKRVQPKLIIHAAAYTDVAKAETARSECWQSNVVGTENMVRAANLVKAKLIHISTDYVFWGDKGGYREEDTPGPSRNYYALTKLVAESLARLADAYLIIRSSFRPREWPYPMAFADVYTSQDYVDVLAPEIALAITHHARIDATCLHIATERKSVYDLAKRRSPDVIKASKEVAKVSLPDDISLDCSRWHKLKERLGI